MFQSPAQNILQPVIVSRTEWNALTPGSYEETHPEVRNSPYYEGAFDPINNPDGYQIYVLEQNDLSSVLDTVTIHHEGDDATHNPASVQLHEMERGFYDIGYHFVIGADGIIYAGRNIYSRGNHAYPNTGNIGILWLGDFNPGFDLSDPLGRYGQVDPTDDIPTQAQYQSTVNLIIYVDTMYGIDSIFGHRELQSTTCPGDSAMPLIIQLRNELAGLLVQR